jgi:uncharacterized C2H2 Zn-finger protein
MTVPPEARDRELFVRCRTCGFSIATGVRAGRVGARAVQPDGQTDPAGDAGGRRRHRCPRCGAEHAYGGGDYSMSD